LIITPHMVLLNYPRTGSTWARGVVRRLHGVADSGATRRLARTRLGWRGFHELTLPIDRTASALRERRRSQHGSWRQIPRWARGREVVSLGRDPLVQLESMYHHGFWRDHPPAPLAEVRSELPAFPDLDLAGYLTLLERFALRDVLQGARPRAEVGVLTAHFLRFFHPRPDEALRALTEEDLDGERLLAELPPLRLLRTERLRIELGALLGEQGYSAAAVEAAMEHSDAAHRNASARAGSPPRERLTGELRARVARRERLLVRLFPALEAAP
jgi:hypothetical protein